MDENKRELAERELNDAAGGNRVQTVGLKESYFNSKNQEVGHKNLPGGPILYVPCDKCGRPMHNGWYGWYCDPCNRHLVCINFYEWHGTAEELMNAGS